MKKILITSVLVATLAGPVSAGGKQPVLVYLFSRHSDFVNKELTEKRFRDTIELVRKYQKPGSGISATVFVSGALSRWLDESDPALKNFVSDAKGRGLVEIGYDGADETTYKRRARPDFTQAATPRDRWLARKVAMGRFLTEYRDIFGEIKPGVSGGLKGMQEVFGEAACVRGITDEFGGDSEYVYQVRKLNRRALMWGLPVREASRNIHGYAGSVKEFANLMSPAPETSPELNWADNVLRCSETSDPDMRVISAGEGPDVLKKALEKLDRSHVRLLQVELSDVRRYMSDFYRNTLVFPPTRYAFDHPDRPALPPEAFANKEDVATGFQHEEAALAVLAQFIADNPGSRFVSNAALLDLVEPSFGQSIAMSEFVPSIKTVLQQWGSDTYLPNHVKVGARYLSVADAFQVLSAALAAQHQTGKLPESVRVARVYGPVAITTEFSPPVGSVKASSVAEACARLASRLQNESGDQLPSNMIPVTVNVGTQKLNGAQFLQLMMQALVIGSPDEQLPIHIVNMLSAAGQSYPKTRSEEDQGGTWTFKPAVLKVPGT